MLVNLTSSSEFRGIDDAAVKRQGDCWRDAKAELAAPSQDRGQGLADSVPSQRRKPSRKRRAAAFLVILLLVLAGLAGLVFWKIQRINAAIAAHSFEQPPIEVSAVKVVLERVPDGLDSIGTLRAIHIVDVAPEVAGRVVAITFEAGQKVRKGDRLLQLDDRLDQAELKSARAKLSYAGLQLGRSKTLVVTQAESRQALDLRQLDFDQAQAAVEQLETQVAQKAVAAPFDGFLGLRQVNLGEFVNAGSKIATLTALDELHVNFAVPQQELSRLKVGGKVVVRSDALPDEEFPATIDAIDPVVDANTRNLTIQATMKNPGNRLRPGLSVTVGVVLPDRDNVILVPATAVQASASGETAFLVKDGKVEIVPVQTGKRIGDDVLVAAGLSPGDTVITRGQLRVYAGAKVAIGSGGEAGKEAQ